MTMAAVLVFLGVLCRVVPHPPNLVAVGAVSLFAGARLPRRWAWLVPIVAMLLSDLYLDRGTGRSFLSGGRLTIYATYGAIAVLGLLARQAKGRPSLLVLPALSLVGSCLFFLTSNFAVWAFDTYGTYSPTLDGLWAAYREGIPFFKNTVAADLAGTAILFGFDALARHAVTPGARDRPRLDLDLIDA